MFDKMADKIDAVTVCTPDHSHFPITIEAMAHGKHVYVEKPMAMNHAECLDMIAAAERSGQRLFVAYYRRALPYFVKARELLDAGAIGTPLTVEVLYLLGEEARIASCAIAVLLAPALTTSAATTAVPSRQSIPAVAASTPATPQPMSSQGQEVPEIGRAHV